MLGELGFPVQANSNFVDVKMGGGGGRVGEKGGCAPLFTLEGKKTLATWLGSTVQYSRSW